VVFLTDICQWVNREADIVNLLSSTSFCMDTNTKLTALCDKLNNVTSGYDALWSKVNSIYQKVDFMKQSVDLMTLSLNDHRNDVGYQAFMNFYHTVGCLLKCFFPDYSLTNTDYDDCDYFVIDFDYYFDTAWRYDCYVNFNTDRREALANITQDEWGGNYWWIISYFCIPLKKASSGLSESFKESLIKLILKDILINQHTNFLVQSDIANTHSRKFLEHLLNKAKDE
jgi:hypothetical protein